MPLRNVYGKKPPDKLQEMQIEDAIQIDNRGDFGLWAIEVAKQIVADQGVNLPVLLAMVLKTTSAWLATLLAKP